MIKIPTSVIICGKKIPVRKNKKVGGGSFDFRIPRIEIGTKYSMDIESIFLHEVIEAILTEKCFRYKLRDYPTENGDYLFVMNHEQFSHFCDDLAYALKDCLKRK